MTKDPVCWEDVDEHRATTKGLTCEHEGLHYFFCSQECLQRFIEEVKAFVAEPSEWEATPSRTEDYFG